LPRGFVIDEAALRRGDPDIMRPQLDHLVELSRMPPTMLIPWRGW
jgi:hypothetical protein